MNELALECLVALPEGWVGWRPPDNSGATYQAALFRDANGDDERTVEASLSIVFHTIVGSNDPAVMLQQLRDTNPDVDANHVDLPSGPAVRRSETREDALTCQYYLPVPGTSDQIAVLSFSAAPERAAELSGTFDRLAQTFTFTAP